MALPNFAFCRIEKTALNLQKLLVECINSPVCVFFAQAGELMVRRIGKQIRSCLTVDLLYHVIDNMAVFMLRAEHDNFCIRIDFYIVSGWPVEEIIRFDRLLYALRIGCCDLAMQDEAPVRTLA